MKQPRLADFDPSAKAGQELHSPLDDMPTIERPSSGRPGQSPTVTSTESPLTTTGTSDLGSASAPLDTPDKNVTPDTRPSAGSNVRTSVRSGVRVFKRTINRYSFEFFRDQVESLRDLSLEEKQRGEAGSMSAMVREAVDAYLAKRRRLEE